MVDKWKSLPVWLQWLLYIPAVIFIPVLISLGMNLVIHRELLPDTLYSVRNFLLSLVNTAIFTLFYVVLALDLAPIRKFLSAWIMFSLLSTLHVIGILAVFYSWVSNPNTFDMKQLFELPWSIVWFVLGVSILVTRKKAEVENKNTIS